MPLQKLLCQHKNQFYWMQIILWSGTKCLWLAQYVNNLLVQHKKIGAAQNILGPVKGKGISWIRYSDYRLHIYFFWNNRQTLKDNNPSSSTGATWTGCPGAKIWYPGVVKWCQIKEFRGVWGPWEVWVCGLRTCLLSNNRSVHVLTKKF